MPLMKRFFCALLVICCILSVAVSASAYTIYDVGSVDRLMASDYITPSSNAAEIEFIEDNSDFVVPYYSTSDTVEGDWTNVEGTLWAYDFGTFVTDLFVIKTGNLKDTTDNTFLYVNVDNLQYAVVDFADFGTNTLLAKSGDFKTNMNAGKISHIGVPVPEPSTILLLGIGLLGLGWYGRKRNKA
jgi:hypothetical protein